MSILGYSEQSVDAIKTVNRNKINEEIFMRLLDYFESKEGVDTRWISIARTYIQQGFMAFNRALMNPKRLTDDELKSGFSEMLKTALIQ